MKSPRKSNRSTLSTKTIPTTQVTLIAKYARFWILWPHSHVVCVVNGSEKINININTSTSNVDNKNNDYYDVDSSILDNIPRMYLVFAIVFFILISIGN